MAAAIARRLLAERGLDVAVASAGTGAADGGPVSDGALLVAMEHGLALEGHRSRALSRELVAAADLILVMGDSHLARVQALGGEGKSALLADFASGGREPRAIGDPFGGDLEVYRRTFDELTREIVRVVDRLDAERDAR